MRTLQRLRWFAVLLAVNSLAALALALSDDVKDRKGGGEDKRPPPTGAMVPFEMLPTNHMVVEAKLNGKGKTYRLIFDLGAPVTLLSGRAAEASGAIGSKAPRSFLFGARGEGKLDKLEVGDLTTEDLPVVVMDHPALSALGKALGRPLDGIIGYTLFARYRTTIDYQAKRMTFTPVNSRV